MGIGVLLLLVDALSVLLVFVGGVVSWLAFSLNCFLLGLLETRPLVHLALDLTHLAKHKLLAIRALIHSLHVVLLRVLHAS